MYVHVHVCFLHSYHTLSSNTSFKWLYVGTVMTCIIQSKRKKVSLPLAQFPLDPSCCLFICLFIFGTRSSKTWCLLACTSLLSYTPSLFHSIETMGLVEDKLAFYWQNSYSKRITDSHLLRWKGKRNWAPREQRAPTGTQLSWRSTVSTSGSERGSLYQCPGEEP